MRDINMKDFPRLPNGDIDENSDEWQQHVVSSVLAAESMDEISHDDYAFIEHALLSKWRNLPADVRVTHALTNSELYRTVQRAKAAQSHMETLLFDINKVVK
jgi:hypothetical protein